MDSLKRDLQLAFRGLAKRPTLSLIAVCTLALGVAANLAIFSVVYGAVLRPLGYSEESRLVTVLSISETEAEQNPGSSLSDFRFLERHQTSFDHLSFYGWSRMTLERSSGSLNLSGVYIDPGLFETLGVEPVAGRALNARDAEAGLGSAAWISEALWRRVWGGETEMLGRTVTLDGRPVEIAGVMPSGLELPNEFADLWVPVGAAQAERARFDRGHRDFVLVGSLASGVSLADSQAEMAAFAERLAEDFPESNAGWGYRVETLREHLLGGTRQPLWIAFAAVSLVLLLACANITHLLLVRASSRRREMSVRAALGAGRGDLARLVMAESLVISLSGGALGTLAAVWLHDVLLALDPGVLPRAHLLSIDGPVLVFGVVISVLAGLLCGVLPALYGSDPRASALHGGRLSSKAQAAGAGGLWRRALLGFEVALSLVLLAGAALLGHTFYQLYRVDPGFDPQGVYMSYFLLGGAEYDQGETRIQYFRRLQEQVASLPGIESAALVTTAPLPGPGIIMDVPYRLSGEEPDGELARRAAFRIATPNYFATAKLPMLAGRDFEWTDDAEAPGVAIVNRTMAQRLWGESGPSGAVGQRFEIDFSGGRMPLEVIGVVADTRFAGLSKAPRPAVFIPHGQMPFRGMAVIVRTSLAEVTFVDSLTQAAAQLDSTVAPATPFSLERQLERSFGLERFFAALLGLFALLAVALTAGGIYGVFSFWVSERTREIGVRVALGAARAEVIGLIVSQGAKVAAWGLLVGGVGAWAVGTVIRSSFENASTAGLGGLVLVAAGLFVVVLGSCLAPALRASRIDGAAALRSE